MQFLFAGAAACGEINPLASHVRLVYRVAAVKKSSPFSSYESDRSRYIPPVVMREYESSVLRLWVPVLTTPSRSNFSAGSIPRDWMFFQFCQNFKAVALRTIIAMILICPVTGRIRHKGSHTRRPLRQACQTAEACCGSWPTPRDLGVIPSPPRTASATRAGHPRGELNSAGQERRPSALGPDAFPEPCYSCFCLRCLQLWLGCWDRDPFLRLDRD